MFSYFGLLDLTLRFSKTSKVVYISKLYFRGNFVDISAALRLPLCCLYYFIIKAILIEANDHTFILIIDSIEKSVDFVVLAFLVEC